MSDSVNLYVSTSSVTLSSIDSLNTLYSQICEIEFSQTENDAIEWDYGEEYTEDFSDVVYFLEDGCGELSTGMYLYNSGDHNALPSGLTYNQLTKTLTSDGSIAAGTY